MKKKSILLFLLLPFFIHAQIVPSSVAEIYSFSIGDSFEYSFNAHNAFGPCRREGVTLNIITDTFRRSDTLFYSYLRIGSSADIGCDYPIVPYKLYFDSTLVSSRIFNADSQIFKSNIHIGSFVVGECMQQLGGTCTESVFYAGINNYNQRKQNESKIQGLSDYDAIFVEGLGIVYQRVFMESDNSSMTESKLIYYHKTSGETWGNYKPIVQGYFDGLYPWGISETSSNTQIVVTPNPAKNSVQIKVASNGRQDEMLYTITDNIGQLVQSGVLSNQSTTLDVSLLSRGLYFVNVKSNTGKRWSNKLVKE
ncbi:MAG: T9SS type A sorting domain-containing protein [Chitinophagales bacterium]|nr:T9SS type A sorting domain-containing protein [Chitinophagales bacterium]